MTDFVCLGPSLPLVDARSILPEAIYLPPVKHGDLIRLSLAPGDRVLIIDGLFMHVAPVRHREILGLLKRGIEVWGSSSMGAMRASELHHYGMLGVGEVFRLMRDGIVTGDDEVAVVHADADNDFACFTEPLVNLRVTLARAVTARALARGAADALLELGRSLPFRERGPRALIRAALAAGLTEAAGHYQTWIAAHPLDIKADDARELLHLAVTAAPVMRVGKDIENVQTSHFRRWQARHQGVSVGGRLVPDAMVAAAIMATHPDFPRLQRQQVLAGLAGVRPGSAGLEQDARAAIEKLGLASDPATSPWLALDERDLPGDEAGLRIVTRAIVIKICATYALDALPEPLRAPEILTHARAFLARAQAVNDRLPRPDPHRPHTRLALSPEALNRLFGRLWHVSKPGLTAAAWDRGFANLTQLHLHTGGFAVLLRLTGQPAFPQVGQITPDAAVARPVTV